MLDCRPNPLQACAVPFKVADTQQARRTEQCRAFKRYPVPPKRDRPSLERWRELAKERRIVAAHQLRRLLALRRRPAALHRRRHARRRQDAD